MKRKKHGTRDLVFSLCAAALMLAGCGKDTTTGSTPTTPAETQAAAKKMPAPVFHAAWSEYPSFSALGAAAECGIINPNEGEMSALEKEYNVDIVLHEADYGASITMYSGGQVDAVTITNMDVISPSTGMKSTAVMPMSTSFGGDCLLVTKDITSLSQLKGKKVYGLSKSVSEYAFNRCLEANGENPANYTFAHKEPDAAALAMQQHQAGFEAIQVWNPFCIDTLAKRSDVHMLCNSTKMPGEIIDMLVISQTSLDKPGGDRFAKAMIAAYYELNKNLANPSKHVDTLMAIGEKFMGIKDPSKMEVILQQTKFFSTADQGLAVFAPSNLTPIMDSVMKHHDWFCEPTLKDGKVVAGCTPTIGYGHTDTGAQLRFDPSYMEAVKNAQ